MKKVIDRLFVFDGEDRQPFNEITSIFNTIDHPVYISNPKTHEILFGNNFITKLFGNATGKKCHKVFQNLNSPCKFCTNDKIFGKNLGKTYIWEFQNRATKSWYHCIDRAILWKDGQYARCEVAIDITNFKQAEEDKKEFEERFRALTDKSPGMIFINYNGKLVYVNDKCSKITGHKKTTLLSPKFNFMSLVAPESRKEVSYFFKKHLKGKEIPPYEYKTVTKNGKILNVINATKIIKYHGKPAILGMVTDITDYKKNEQDNINRLKNALNQTVNALSMITQKKDTYTSEHQQNVAKLACAIAKKMGLPEDQIEGIRTASILHDIGKINIPGEILAKPSTLTSLEFNIIKSHADSSYDILKMIEFPWPVSEIVLQHHERINGSGYPHKMPGKKLLIESKILAVADVVEAMAHHRPYRASLGIKKALEEISKNKNKLYDPKVTDTCIELFRKKQFKFN